VIQSHRRRKFSLDLVSMQLQCCMHGRALQRIPRSWSYQSLKLFDQPLEKNTRYSSTFCSW